jgi:hypothetical protein
MLMSSVPKLQRFQQQMQFYAPAQQAQYQQMQQKIGWTPPPIVPNATMIQVIVPGGFMEGSSFPTQYGGRIFSVQVPPGVKKDQVIMVQVPPELVCPQAVNVGGRQFDIQQVIAQFAALDRNGNGKITPDEMRMSQQAIMGANL